MADRFERLYRLYGKVTTLFGVIAGVIAFGIMWLIDANALLRKLFNTPLAGSLELTEAGLVLIVFFGLAFTQQRRGHIRVTLLTRRLPLGVRHGLFIFAMLIGAALTAWYVYAAYGYAVRSFRINEQEWGLIKLPIWPIKMSIVVGLALFSFQFLLDAIRHCFVAAGKLAPIGDEP